MASWKKVIVSGSNAHLTSVTASSTISVGTNQVITTSPSTTFLSGSFSGSFIGNGQGLTGIAATSFNIPNDTSNLSNSDFVVVSSSAGLNKITYANLLTDLAGTNLVNESNDSLALSTTLTGLTSVSATSFTGSLLGNVNGNASTATTATQVGNSLTAGNGISMASYNGNTASTVNIKSASAFTDNIILKWDTGGNQFEPTSLTDNGTGTISGNSSIQLTGANSILTGSFSGSFTGDGSNLTGVGASVTNPGDNRVLTSTGTSTGVNGETNLTFDGNTNLLTINGTLSVAGTSTIGGTAIINGANGIQSNQSTFNIVSTGTSNPTVNIGNASNSTVTIGNNLVVNGNLTANGTASFINSTNLFVADRFAVFGSGSSTNIDGGFIVQNSTLPAGTGSGYAFYIETGGTPRWAITSSLNGNAVSATADEYMVTAKSTTGDPTGNPTWGGSSAGFGNIYVNSTDESIWIYS